MCSLALCWAGNELEHTREKPVGSTVTGTVVGCHASTMVRREHSSACGKVTHASDQLSSSKKIA